jgi:hypothetical protein
MTTEEDHSIHTKNRQWSKRKGKNGRKKNRKERHGRITTQRQVASITEGE